MKMEVVWNLCVTVNEDAQVKIDVSVKVDALRVVWSGDYLVPRRESLALARAVFLRREDGAERAEELLGEARQMEDERGTR